MGFIRQTATALLFVLLVGCGPGIRFRPGEIPTPGAPNPAYVHKGQQLHGQVMAKGAVLRDRAAEKRVSRILSKLLDATPSTGHWTATLLDDPSFNAMTAPGNYIFVHRGLLEGLPQDDEVAAVLAHEIGHRLAQHEIETSEETLGKAISILATIAAGVAVASQRTATGRDVDNVMNATNKLGQGLTTLRYSKDKEREADQIGMFLMADAGFNPAASARLWASRMAKSGSSGSDFFSTHPLHEDRYEMAIRLLPLAEERYKAALKSKRNKRSTKRPSPPSSILTAQIAQAEEAIADDDLQTASTIAQSLTKQEPKAPEVFNLLGRVKALSGEQSQASKAFKKGLSLAPNDPIITYNIACLQAREGKRFEALANLEKAFSVRPSLTSSAADEPDLESLHEDVAFKALLERVYVPPAPENVGDNSLSVN
jgi:predicted Zn-dependent protease